MTPKLSVVVHVDMDGRHVRVAVTGRLTTINQQGLHPVIDHARVLTPDVTVTVDLSATDCLDSRAVAQLRQALNQAAGSARPVTVLAPGALSAHHHLGSVESVSRDDSAEGSTPPPASIVPRCSSRSAPAKPQHRCGASMGAPCRTKPGPALTRFRNHCDRDARTASARRAPS